ncbi:hypothetical protein L0F63_005548 [Massospora cicadina]|nr:hypothetical protein L0F63_005548 [Massospora cicadina]
MGSQLDFEGLDVPPTPFQFYDQGMVETTAPKPLGAFISIAHPDLDTKLGVTGPDIRLRHATQPINLNLVMELSVDFSMVAGGLGRMERRSLPIYLPAWSKPLIDRFGSSGEGSGWVGPKVTVLAGPIDQLPIANKVHLLPIQLAPNFPRLQPEIFNLEGSNLNLLALNSLRHQPFRGGSLVPVTLIGQAYLFQIGLPSGTAGGYFRTGPSTSVTFSLNHHSYDGWELNRYRFGGELTGTIHTAQLRELVKLIDWALRQDAEPVGPFSHDATLILGPPGIGKSTFLKAVGDVFRYSRGDRVGVVEIHVGRVLLEARKLEDASSYLLAAFDLPTMLGGGVHSAHLVIIHGLHLCFGSDGTDHSVHLLAAVTRFLSSHHPNVYRLAGSSDPPPKASALSHLHCVRLEPPGRDQREQLLKGFLDHPIKPTALHMLTHSTHTYTPADLKYLANTTLSFHRCAPNGIDARMAGLSLDGEVGDGAAQRALEETARRRKPGVVAALPNVTFDQVGGYANTKARLQQILMLLGLEGGNKAHRLGLKRPSGLLLVGPSGCGKTRLAQAVANHTHRHLGHHFLHVKGPSLFSKYFGGTEAAVRDLFLAARTLAPCTLFLDELDALGPKRGWGSQGDGAGDVSARVLSTLLNELDGAHVRGEVFVVACTSLPHRLDDALVRPGRFDTTLLVDLPTLEDRQLVIHALMSHDYASVRFALTHADVAHLANLTEGFSPADLAWVLREAAVKAFEGCHAGVTLGLILGTLEGRSPTLRQADLVPFDGYRTP